MNSFLGISLLIAVNLVLVAASQNGTIVHNSTVTEQRLPHAGLTVPGTKWCGLGKSASTYDDLGIFNQTDMCCRAHQQCGEIMEPLGSLHSLYNPSILPKYDCKCEQNLLDCLHEVHDIPATVIGQAYFSVMQQCFAENYPAVQCVEYQEGYLAKRCIRYKFDDTQEKVWQFFDLPFYTMKEE